MQEALEREREVKINHAVGRSGGEEVEDSIMVQLPIEAEKEILETMARMAEGAPGATQSVEMAIDAEMGTEAGPSVEMEKLVDEESPQKMSTANSRTLDYTRVKEIFMDLFSDRQVSVRKWDLTTWVLEGAATGMAVAGLIAVLLRPR